MAKIYRAIQIKLNQSVKENVRMITDVPAKRRLFRRHHSDKHLLSLIVCVMLSDVKLRYLT